MPLTHEQAQRAASYLEAYRDQLTCSLCGHKHFTIHNDVVSAPVVAAPEGGMAGITLGQGLAAVAVTCHSCGLIRFFSAARMGLVEHP